MFSAPRIFEIFTILGYIENIFYNNAKKLNLDDEVLNRILVKLSVRLLWERTINFHNKNNKVQKEFIKKSKSFLKKYSKTDILKYKDPFINLDVFDNWKFFKTKCIEDRKIYKIAFFKVKVKQKDKNENRLEPLLKDIKHMRSELIELSDNYYNIVLDSLSDTKYMLSNNTSLGCEAGREIIGAELNKLEPDFYFIPNPGNLGDVIIAQSEYEFLANRNYKIIDNEEEQDEETINHYKQHIAEIEEIIDKVDNDKILSRHQTTRLIIFLEKATYHCKGMISVLNGTYQPKRKE